MSHWWRCLVLVWWRLEAEQGQRRGCDGAMRYGEGFRAFYRVEEGGAVVQRGVTAGGGDAA
jgi:hypothetical protein